MNFWEQLNALWQNFDITTGILIFISYIVVDGLYAYYTIAVQKYKAVKAATTGSLMYVLLAYGVISYTHNILYLIPLAIGSWVGTYAVIKYEGALAKRK